MEMTTTELIKNLNDYIVELYGNMDPLDLENVEQIEELRNEIKKWMKTFDEAELTAINFAPAIHGGAKATVEQKIITRNMASRISQETGYSKDVLLYSGLSKNGREKFVAKNIQKKRIEDILESFDDFQTQLKVKHILLKLFKENYGITKQPRIRRLNQKFNDKLPQRTPKNKFVINPLDMNVLNEKYYMEKIDQFNVKVSKKPIPFNLDESF